MHYESSFLAGLLIKGRLRLIARRPSQNTGAKQLPVFDTVGVVIMPILTKYCFCDINDEEIYQKELPMDKMLRNVNERLWREVKSQAALDGVSMTSWVEKVIAEKLGREDLLTERSDKRRRITTLENNKGRGS